MENNTIHVSGAVVCSLVILIFLTAFVMVLVPVVRAEDTGKPFLGDWTLINNGVNVPVKSSPPPFILPEVIADTTSLKGYYDNNNCPIGITVGGKVAPHLRDPGFASGASCRGACGPDCPTGRCKQLPEIAIENKDKTGTCWYYGVIECPTDTGCQEHDSCFDWCANNWDKLTCYSQCNERCFDKYGFATCAEWADLPGRTGKYSTKLFDSVFRPTYNQPKLKYSYPPDFRENPITLTPTTTAQTTQQVPITTIVPPTTTTTVPTTKPVTTKTISGPDTRLTVIMTGDLTAEEMEGTSIGWSPEALEQSCSPTSTGGQCILKYPYGTTVEVATLTSGGVRFIGWFGSCSGSGDCTVSMTKDKTVTAQFNRIPTTPVITNYQEYCTSNYPGSYYNAAEGTCQFHRVTPTSGAVGSHISIPSDNFPIILDKSDIDKEKCQSDNCSYNETSINHC
ncbi:MAG: hypothetical protein Q7U51_03475, partial [Methanoregula sp.]|nr:hypothetical protein [Methanoregula sp.]